MFERIIQEEKANIIWVLVADAKQAQCYIYQHTHQNIPLSGSNHHQLTNEKDGHSMVEVQGGHMKAGHHDDHLLGHDPSARAIKTNAPLHNHNEPNGDYKKDNKVHFSIEVAQKINQASLEKLFQQLIVIAPSRMLGELREHLHRDTKKQIIVELAKELTHIKGQELIAHVEDLLKKTETT